MQSEVLACQLATPAQFHGVQWSDIHFEQMGMWSRAEIAAVILCFPSFSWLIPQPCHCINTGILCTEFALVFVAFKETQFPPLL